MSQAPEGMVEADLLSRRFGHLAAVDRFTLQVARGEIFGLVGPDGSGKTTTMRLLSGLLRPTGGSASVAGCDVVAHRERLRDQIGYMPQRFGLYLDLSVEENLRFCADLFGVGGQKLQERLTRLLEMTRLAPFRHRQAGKLSGGMKQKLALMSALLHRPAVLLLDEPTNGVDPVSRREFWAILYELLQEGITILVSTAYLDEAERCNRVGLMHQGRLIACDRPGEMASHLEEACFELTTDQLREARQLLQEEPGVLSAEAAGRRIHLFLHPSRTPDEIEARLTQAGLGPARLKPVKPSLEDVFIAMIRRARAAKRVTQASCL